MKTQIRPSLKIAQNFFFNANSCKNIADFYKNSEQLLKFAIFAIVQ